MRENLRNFELNCAILFEIALESVRFRKPRKIRLRNFPFSVRMGARGISFLAQGETVLIGPL